jgi:hypothetical protein
LTVFEFQGLKVIIMNLKQSLFWQRMDDFGTEHCNLWQHDAGWQLEGVALTLFNRQLSRAHYQVWVDPQWRTYQAEINMQLDGIDRTLQLVSDKGGRWWVAGQEDPTLGGCIDVDLRVTPATNILPIRRLELPVGGSEQVTAAWVRFPELTVEVLPQRYTRLSATQYRYESSNGAFTAELEVDELGMVIDYPGGWQRIATYTAA